MYLRAIRKTNLANGAIYTTHQLVESHRTEKGPRQRMIMHLEGLDLPKLRWRELAMALEAGLTGQSMPIRPAADIQALAASYLAQQGVKDALRYAEVARQDRATARNVSVDLDSVRVSLSRSLGPELVGHAFFERLGFPRMLAECGLDLYQRDLAEAVILGRLIAPDSDLGTWRWLRARTSLPEFVASDLEKAGKDAVYEIADHLWQHRAALETGLRKRENALYPRAETIVLYDLTNSHFEGRCLRNPLAKRGHSKQMRSDCPLVTLALVVDSQGFPLFSQIYAGNQSEPQTLAQILKQLKEDGGDLFDGAKPTLVMDRGIATADNCALMRAEHYPYLVIERREEAKDFEEEFQAAPAGFEEVKERAERERVWIKKVIPAPNPKKPKEPILARVLCFSEGRLEKERGMDRLKEERFLEDLEKLRKAVAKGSIKDGQKANQRIGRLLERYPSITSRYQITLTPAEDPLKVAGVSWVKTEKHQTRGALQGCYVIQTTHLDLDAERIWSLYISLVRVEAAFHSLKSDLGLRPVRHHLEDRTRAHLFVSVLAYHVLACIERSLMLKGDTRRWATIREELSTHQRSTVSLRSGLDTIHQVRVSGTPEDAHEEIYRTLEIQDPLPRMRRDLNVRL
jgi:transposase